MAIYNFFDIGLLPSADNGIHFGEDFRLLVLLVPYLETCVNLILTAHVL
jgi:hypothetical protein